MKEWLEVKKGGTLFGFNMPAPRDFWILTVDEKILGCFTRDPLKGGYLVLKNPEFFGGFKPEWLGNDELTIVEAKDAVEKLLMRAIQ